MNDQNQNVNRFPERIMDGLILLLCVGIFHYLGNTAEPQRFSRSIFIWATHRWSDYGGYFDYGYFIPLISGWLVWRQRKLIRETPKTIDNKALVFIVLSLLLHVISSRIMLPRFSMLALICLCWSIAWFRYGKEIARILLFPCSYLLFCIPLNFLEKLTFPLRSFSSVFSTELLQGFGLNVARQGTGIYSVGSMSYMFDVADACSGLKYFIVLTALAALYSNLTQKTLCKKWVLFLLAPPIAVLSNSVRIMAIVVAAELTTPEIANTVYHDLSGYIVFISALLILFAADRTININIKETLNKWKAKQLERK